MRPQLSAALLALVTVSLAGCEAPKVRSLAFNNPPTPTITAPPRSAPPPTATLPAPPVGQCGPVARQTGPLAGRTLAVSSVSDIALRPGEVVLTFDDGPMPGKTAAILDTLDAAGVKATFLMVGLMADNYPQLVRKVAARGHTIGTHTYRHTNLSRLGQSAALAEIARGEKAVATALSGSGHSMAPFFRFPYLADTPDLRAALARRGTVVIDVDIDSKDYFRTSGQVAMNRTLAALRRRGKGIILFHDIHARTVSMLPSFLDALEREGYKVVQLVPGGAGGCGVRGS